MPILPTITPKFNPAKPSFSGFKPLTSNFTNCPNQFFDKVAGHYQSCVVSVVAILIRSTLGWQDDDTKERRIEADLSLAAFVRPELSETSARKGIAGAIEAGFIIQTRKPTNKQSARYALRWDDAEQQTRAIEKQRRAQGTNARRGVKTEPHKWESAAVKGTTSRGADSRGLDSRGLDSRGLTVTPPIYKESLKKSYSEKKEEEEKEKKEEAEVKIFSSLSLSQIAEQKEPEPEQEKPVPEKPEVTCKTMLAFRKARREMSKEWFIREHGRPSNEHDWMGAVIKAEAEAAAAEKGEGE